MNWLRIRLFILSFNLLGCQCLEIYVPDDPTIAFTGLWSQSSFADQREAPNIQGIFFTAKWRDLQPAKDMFDWTDFDKDILDITERNLGVSLRIYTGQNAPQWIYEEGVPEVKVNCSKDCSHDDSFPYYPDPAYQDLYFQFVTIFREHLETLPLTVQKNILFIQAMYGTTGDVTPWHGVPIDPQFQNCTEHSEEFVAYVKLTTTHFCNEYANTDPNIKLLLNRRSDLDEFYDKTCPKHWMKEGMVSHGYQLNEELDAEDRYMEVLRSSVDGFLIRGRGENAQDTTEDGWWQQAVASNFMAHMAWMLYFGMDFHELSEPYISEDYLQPAFEFFNRHVTDKNVDFAVGGFCYFRKELDSSDVLAYPEDEFGVAKKQNKERMIKIAEANMQYGAKQEDPDHGVGNPMHQRDAKQLNDVGWMIHRGNYEANLLQIDADNTSVGRWRVGNGSVELYGRFARSFENISGKNEMYFSLNSSILNGLPLTERRDLIIRVAYFDEGFGYWNLKYDGMGEIDQKECDTVVFQVEKRNSMQWTDVSWVIEDGYFGGRGKAGADIWLESGDEEDDIFGMIEIFDPMIKFNSPDHKFVNFYSISATYVDAHKPDTIFNERTELFMKKDKKIGYFKFPEIQTECQVDKVFIKFWPSTGATQLRELLLHRTLDSWDPNTLSWNTRPEISEALFSFSLENGTLYTNVDVTEIFEADQTLLTGFALTALNDESGQIKLHNHIKDSKIQESRIVIYCKD